MKISTFFIILLASTLITTSPVHANERPGTKWKFIESRETVLIYPDDISDKFAADLAVTIDRIYNKICYTINSNRTEQKTPKTKNKLKIILNTRNLVINGFVSLIPPYATFFTQPPVAEQVYYGNWMETLATHELRHALQMEAFYRQSLSVILSILNGATGKATAIGISTPRWFTEGDATLTETIYTDFGRGRDPAFTALSRNLLLENHFPKTYKKMINGSYRKLYPDPYEFGYLFNLYLRTKYGYDLPDKLYDEQNEPLSSALFRQKLRKITNKGIYRHYNDFLQTMHDWWVNELREREVEDYPRLVHKKKIDTYYYTSHRTPVSLDNDGTFIFSIRGGDLPGAIIRQNSSGNQTTIRITPHRVGSFSRGNNWLVWAEGKIDPRWNEYYSNITLTNLKTNRVKKISYGTKLYAPSVSSDDKFIAVIEFKYDTSHRVLLIDLESEQIIATLDPEPGKTWNGTSWGNNHNLLFLTEVSSEGRSIIEYNVKTGQKRKVFGPYKSIINSLYYHQSNLYFHATFDGYDNIYMVDLNTKKTYRITSSKYGAFDPNLTRDGKTLMFSEFTENGYDIVSIPISERKPLPVDPAKLIEVNQGILDSEPLFASELSNAEKLPVTDSNNSALQFEPKKYYPGLHLFNYHSWFPSYSSTQGLRLELQSDDIHAKLSHRLILEKGIPAKKFIGYKEANNDFTIGAAFSLAAFYPLFETVLWYQNGHYLTGPSTNLTPVEKSLFYSQTRVILPFHLNGSKTEWFIKIGPGISAGYSKGLWELSQIEGNIPITEIAWTGYFNAVFSLSGNPILFNHPYLRGGLQLYYYQFFKDPSVGGQKLFANGFIDIPGFFRRHQIVMSGSFVSPGAYLQQTTQNYFIRGLPKLLTPFWLLSLDYRFPLAYPDLSLGLIYLKEMEGGLFYDRQYGVLNNTLQPDTGSYLHTAGIEATLIFTLLDIPHVPITFTYQLAIIPGTGTLTHGFFIGLLQPASF